MSDPFVHHPGLRGKITDPETSFFRDFNMEKMFATLDQHGLPRFEVFSDEEREANRKAVLADRPAGPLWIFGYGSLMWDPALRFAEVRRAHMPGHQRRFILVDTLGGRGTADVPGAMAALDKGGACNGLIFRIADEDITCETQILWQREHLRPAYHPTFIRVETEAGPEMALTFVADHAADMIYADLSRDQQIRYLATGAGFLGSSADYLRGIVEKFEILGIEDPETEQLLAEVEAYSARVG